MKKKISLLASLFAVTVLHAQTGNTAISKWPVQTDSAYHFSFKYPRDWRLKLPGSNTRFIITSSLENTNDRFRENINCMARAMSDTGFKIQDSETEVTESLKSKMPEFKLLASGYKKWNGYEALYMDYTTTNKDGDNLYKLRIYQQMSVVKNILFVFTYTAEENRFNQYWNSIAAIIQSVKPAL